MYNIKAAASRAGVSVAVMRQWERRYGVVHPGRTDSGYRRYDEAAIARVRAMRGLVRDGWAPSSAAAAIMELDDAHVTTLLQGQLRPREGGPLPPTRAGDLVEAFERSAAALDTTGVEAVLDEMFSRGSFELVAEQYLAPGLRLIGDAWVRGDVDVAAEHAASHAVARRLAIAYQAAARPSRDERPILVGLPPGARHELGALMFSTVARRTRLPVLHLGADLPVSEWVDAAMQTDAAAAVIGAIAASDAAPAAAVVEALARSRPSMPVAVGGAIAGDVRTLTEVILLPHGLANAVEVLRASVFSRQPH